LSSSHDEAAERCSRHKRRNAGTTAVERDLGYRETPVKASITHKKGTSTQSVVQVPETLCKSKCTLQVLPVACTTCRCLFA
jgi:hypothetical protein